MGQFKAQKIYENLRGGFQKSSREHFCRISRVENLLLTPESSISFTREDSKRSQMTEKVQILQSFMVQLLAAKSKTSKNLSPCEIQKSSVWPRVW